MMKRYRLPNGTTWTTCTSSATASELLQEETKKNYQVTSEVSTQAITATTSRVFLQTENHRKRFWIYRERDKRILAWHGGSMELTEEELTTGGSGQAKELLPLRLTMPGKVVDVKIQEGDIVEKGQCLVVVEAMKMENNLLALGRAKVKKIHVKKDDRLESGSTLITFEAP